VYFIHVNKVVKILNACVDEYDFGVNEQYGVLVL
jgi:hypothetical protein